MFPQGSQTDFYYFSGAGSHTVTTLPATLLGYSFKQGNVSSDTDLRCGTTVLFKNESTDISHTMVNYYCQDGLNYAKTGNDNAQIVTTYILGDYNMRSTTTVTTVATSSFPQYTQADFFTQFLLIIMILSTIFGAIYRGVFGTRVKINYLNS